ncbi:MAG: hypothetical protein LBG60_08805 [Bifidobacteriaceae bacterium]|nr:hypothetical protein [Bifidobacteriaceae bacterium]
MTSIQTIASYRSVALAPLLPTLEHMTDRSQPKWAVWRARTGRTSLPERLADVVRALSGFTDPVITGQAKNKTWNPTVNEWQ